MSRLLWDPDRRDFVPPAEFHSKRQSETRSEFPMPYVIGALAEYRSMATGEMITDRRRHREHLRERGLVEVGNERLETPSTKSLAPAAPAVKDAIDQLRAGHKTGPDVPLERVDTENTRIYKD